METITKEQIEHIAGLARLGITNSEKDKYAIDLAKILDYFRKLQQVNTDNVIPIKQITGLTNTVRDDEIKIFPRQEDILNNTPERKNKFIKVKSVL